METGKTLTVAQLLKRPLFQHARLVAGCKGVDRKVGWIHILEISTPNPSTNQDDFILTTGLGFNHFADNRLTYMQQLIDQNASGLCIEMGPYFPEVPSDMLELANSCQFPIVIFETPVRFVDITQDVHSLLINKQYQILKELELYSTKLQHLSLESTNIQSILRLCHEYTSSRVVYYSLIENHLFFPPVRSGEAERLIGRYRGELEKKTTYSLSSSLIPVNDTTRVLSQPVVCLGQILSYIGIVIDDEPPNDFTVLLLDHTCKAIAHLLLRKLFIEQKMAESQSRLIKDILENRGGNEEHLLARIGLQSYKNGGYLVLGGIIEIEPDPTSLETGETEGINQDILVILRSLLSKNGIYHLLFEQNNQIFILCIKDAFKNAASVRTFYHTIRQTLDQFKHSIRSGKPGQMRIYCGFGSAVRRVIDSPQSFQEAFNVLSVARAIPNNDINPFYDDLGIYRLIKGISDEKTLSAFIDYYLGAIITHDQANNTDLLHTLEQYLMCMGSKQETAERLFIHRQTLYNRLDKLKELLGDDFLQPEKRICYEVALRAYALA
ncbi:PucR family transcriptional regulator [Cohnella massiliensis]|uniref:PucR family transcriptional regulator n=1 Tax=Cohnella massiliensis TaxID=1816691 RepID=UPI0009B9C634|nr:PucR family transcriptional regulator ligand-binding domain-containing protein [Cohnella massiliensis]